MTKQGYDALMHEACVVWGFCGCIKKDLSLHVDLFIPPDGPVSSDQFVEWLFLAENLNPNSEPERWTRHKAAMRAAFVQHMGADFVDARRLRWSSVVEAHGEDDTKFRDEPPDR